MACPGHAGVTVAGKQLPSVTQTAERGNDPQAGIPVHWQQTGSRPTGTPPSWSDLQPTAAPQLGVWGSAARHGGHCHVSLSNTETASGPGRDVCVAGVKHTPDSKDLVQKGECTRSPHSLNMDFMFNNPGKNWVT